MRGEVWDGVPLPGGALGLEVLTLLEEWRPGTASEVELGASGAGRISLAWLDGPTEDEVRAALVRAGVEISCTRTLSLRGAVAAVLAGEPSCLLLHSPAQLREIHAQAAVCEVEVDEVLAVALGCWSGDPVAGRLGVRHARSVRLDRHVFALRVWLAHEGIALAQSALRT